MGLLDKKKSYMIDYNKMTHLGIKYFKSWQWLHF